MGCRARAINRSSDRGSRRERPPQVATHLTRPRMRASDRASDMRDSSLETPPVRAATSSPARALILATVSFTLSFAAWGLIGGVASIFAGLYGLSASQTALLVAVPVLLGSLARLPMGMLDGSVRRAPRLYRAPGVLVASPHSWCR